MIPCWNPNMNHRTCGYGPGVKWTKKSLNASHRFFWDLKIHFWCHLCLVLSMLQLNINFFLQSDLTDSTQLNFLYAQNVTKRPQTGITEWSSSAKKVHDNSLEMIGQTDTCNNLEKPSSEQCKLLNATPLWIFQYCLLEVPWRGILSRIRWWIKSIRTIHLMAFLQALLYMVIFNWNYSRGSWAGFLKQNAAR